MKRTSEYESAFSQVLKREGLADLAQYHERNSFEEVTLYSRLADVSFLSGHSLAEKNSILLGLSLKFLDSVVSYRKHRTTYFAAITIRSFDDEEPVVPSIFTWFDHASRLQEEQSLKSVDSSLGRSVRRWLAQIPGAVANYDVREDSVLELSRVFIGPVKRPYPHFVLLDDLTRPLVPARRQRA